jgi:4-hydroxybenzoate polyprenyltransferase
MHARRRDDGEGRAGAGLAALSAGWAGANIRGRSLRREPIPGAALPGRDRAVPSSDQARSGSPGFIALVITSLRPRQWLKNLVVFAALIFAQRLGDPEQVTRSVLGFLLFCITSGAIYIINDLFDADRDRLHPLKAQRPIASGALGVAPAAATAAILLIGALLAAFTLSRPFGAILLIYAIQNILYSLWLKEVVIIDVMVIAAGFVLRAVGGALIIDVPISTWLIICTILLSLFLAFCKRRQELESLDDEAGEHRPALREYSVDFIDQMINVVTASTVVAYTFYTVSPEVEHKLGTQHLYLTVPFVLYGIFRYLYLVHRKGIGGNPTQALLTDRPLLTCVALWGITVVALLYTAQPMK